MTREEARIKLIEIKAQVEVILSMFGLEISDVYDIAIKALSAEPCGDCISRQAVEKITWEEPNYTDALNVLTEVRDKIRALPSVNPQQPKWIPVSERLPECCIEVLTCSNGGFIEIQSLDESYGGYWENQKGDWSDFDEVIAWMLLPEPYKAEKEENNG